MSQENLEIVRRALDAWNSRDNDIGFSLPDPEIEVEVNRWGNFNTREEALEAAGLSE
jgi:hypothetical protein